MTASGRHRRVGADRDVFATATCYAGATCGGQKPPFENKVQH